jgi:hypothetical protein
LKKVGNEFLQKGKNQKKSGIYTQTNKWQLNTGNCHVGSIGADAVGLKYLHMNEGSKNFLMIHLCWSSCKLNLLQEIKC